MESNENPTYSNGQTREELIKRLPIPGPGRKKDTPVKKIQKKIIKQLVEEYKESLAEALKDISPVLKEKAKSGDMAAIREINDILVDKAIKKTDITSGGQPIPLLGGLSNGDIDNSNQEITQVTEEDSGN